MPYKRKAFIIQAEIVDSVKLYWQSKFPGALYCKAGPATLGDTKIEVKKGETSIEVFSDPAEKFIREVIDSMLFPWREVEVIWHYS